MRFARIVTKPPRLVAVVSLCTIGPGIVARFGVAVVLCWLGASAPFYRKREQSLPSHACEKGLFRGRSLAHE